MPKLHPSGDKSRVLSLCCALVLFCAVSPDIRAGEPAANDASEASFSRQIAPVLLKHCLACHGTRDPQGGYQLHNFTLLSKGGESGSPAIVPGKPEESELFSLIASDDADVRMPKEGDPLPPETVELVRRWIAEGAKFDGPDPRASLATFAPRPPHPQPPEVYRRPLPIAALAFRPDGAELAAGGYHEITLWNPADGGLTRRIKDVAERTYGLCYSPDGALLAAAGGTPGASGEVKLFSAADGPPARVLGTMSDVAFRAVFNPAGTKIAACGADRAIRVYDAASGKEEVVIEDHADWVLALAWSPDGARLASASRDKTSKVFNAASGESLATYSGHGETVYGVAFSADGKRVLSAGVDRKVHAWNPEDGAKLAEAGGFGGDVLTLTLAGDKLFTAGADRTVRQHRGEKLELFRGYADYGDVIYALAYHEPSQRVAAAGFSGEIRLWNGEDGSQSAAFVAAPGFVPAAK